MPDVATLGIKIENGEVVQAATSLEAMAVAGAKTEIATERLTRRMALAEIAAREMDAELGRTGRAMLQAETEARKMDAEMGQVQRAMALVEIEARKMDAEFGKVSRAMALAEIEARKMDAEMGRAGLAMAKLETDARKMDAEFDQAKRAMALVEIEARKMDAAFGQTSRAMALAEIEARKMDAEMDKAGRTSFRLTGGFGGLASALQALAGAMVIREVIGLADAYTGLHARIALVTTDAGNLAAVEAALFRVSQDTRTGLASNVDLYTSLARSTKSLGLSQADLVAVTGTVAKSFKISGAGAQETDAAVRQLSQAFASGVLRGDEFNSIAENAPRLQQAVATSLGVTIGQLRAMAAEGKITGAVIAKALLEQGAAISAEFARMPTTVSGAMTQIRNALLLAVGATDSAQGSTAGLASALSSMAEAIPAIASAMNAFFGGLQLMAADAGIAVERLSGSIGRFLKDHPRFHQGAAAAVQALPFGGVIAERMRASVAGADESADMVRLLESRRAELVARLTALGVGSVSAGHGTSSTPTGLSKEELKAAARAEAQDEQAALAQRLAEYNHFVAEQKKVYAEGSTEAVRQFEADDAERMRIAKDFAAEVARAEKDAAHEAARDRRQQLEETARILRSTFSTFFAGVLTQGKSAFQSLFDAIKTGFIRLMADLAGEALQKRLAGMLGGFLFSGRSGAGNTNPVSGLGIGMLKDAGKGALAGGLIGYGVGSMTTDRGLGALGGAASGALAGAAVAGPIGAAAGALVGFVGGIMGAGNAAREAAKHMEALRLSYQRSIEAIKADLAGDTYGAAAARINATFDELKRQLDEMTSFWAQIPGGKGNDEYQRRVAELEAVRLASLAKEKKAIESVNSASLNMVQGYKLQAAVFAAMSGVSSAPGIPSIGSHRWAPGTGSATSAVSGDLTVNLVLDGAVAGKVVLKDFKRRQARGDADLASVLGS